MKINETIRSRRKQLGLTQEQVANRLGVTATAVYKWGKCQLLPRHHPAARAGKAVGGGFEHPAVFSGRFDR